MPDRAKLARAKAANVLALLLIVGLVGALLSTEAARRRYKVQAEDFSTLLTKERAKVRTCVDRRLELLANRVDAIPNKEITNAYQARLAVVRQRFVGGMRWPATSSTCQPVPVPAPVATGRADEACPFSEEEAVNARSTAQQLAALQAWVRENMGEVK
jgi:hypothetical protein